MRNRVIICVVLLILAVLLALAVKNSYFTIGSMCLIGYVISRITREIEN